MTKQSNTRKSKAICISAVARQSGRHLIEGPDDVFICPECVDVPQYHQAEPPTGGRTADHFPVPPKPREIKEYWIST
jgi:hypothetical protein